MSALAAGPLIADLVLAVLVIEAAFLIARRARTGRGPSASALLSMIIPGAFLVLALRFALAETGPAAIGSALIAAGVSHVIDLRRRWGG